MSENTVLVTGGAGYLGSHLIEILLEKGYKVRCFDRLIFGSESLESIKDNSNFQFIKGDIRHIEELAIAMQGCNSVVHLAGLVGDPMCDLNDVETTTVNVESTKLIIELCKLYNIERFLFASSCSVYGYTEGLECNEGSITEPLSVYAKTKLDSEKLIIKAMDDKFTPVILRLATLCGASTRMRFDLVLNIMAARAYEEKKIKIIGGEQWRPLLDVRDAAIAFVSVLEAPTGLVRGQIFNAGANEQNFKIKELAHQIRGCFTDLEVELVQKEKDERSYRVSFDKIRHVLNFRPEKTVMTSIKNIKKLFEDKKISDKKKKKYYNVNYDYFMRL